MRTPILLLPALLVLSVVPVAAAEAELDIDPDATWCQWNPFFAQLVYDATLGVVHLHDGRICTAHVHEPSLDEPGVCEWSPDFAQLVYDVSLGLLHPHGGVVCWVHPHL